MGVAVGISVYASDEADARDAGAAAFAEFARLDSILSDYRPSSELSRLSSTAVNTPTEISPTLYDVLQRSQQFTAESGGAFDVTCGAIVRLWRDARKTRRLPAAADLQSARRTVGGLRLSSHDGRSYAEITVPGTRLDVGGIGKGYAADAAMKVLREHGIQSALIQAGGDVLASAAPPGEAGWQFDLGDGQLERISNIAVSTSGDSEQFVDIGGVRYSHVVDPRTGQALTNHAAATIYAPDSTLADALSKALTVLDEDGAKKLLDLHHNVRAVIKHPASPQ